MTHLSHKEKKRLRIIARMESDWIIDTANLEIRLKEMPWYIQFWNWLTLKRYTVRELYIFVYDYFHRPSNIKRLMPISFPIDHDNIKKPKGVPFNFVMQGGWEIPSDYLPKLIEGPLISEDGSLLLVKTDSRLDHIGRLFRRLIGWMSIPGALYGSIQALEALF